MRALILTCSSRHPRLPLRLFDEQVVAGPHWPDAQTLHGRWRSLRTPAGDYDVTDILAKIPSEQSPDVILCLLDQTPVSRPRNLQCFDGRRILIAIQQCGRAIDFDYAAAESFDEVIIASERCSLEDVLHSEPQRDWSASSEPVFLPHEQAC